MSDTRQNKMFKRLLWRLWVSRNASYYPLHKPASSWFSLGFFHSFSLTFQTKFQVRSHDIYCTTFPHINFVVWHSGRMRTNFDARSSREEQPSCNFKFINFRFLLHKRKIFVSVSYHQYNVKWIISFPRFVLFKSVKKWERTNLSKLTIDNLCQNI